MQPESSSNSDNARRQRQLAWRQVGEYSGLAIALPVAAVLGYAAGSWLDARLGIEGLHVVGLLLGIASGFTQLVTKALRDSKRESLSNGTNAQSTKQPGGKQHSDDDTSSSETRG